MKANLRNSDLNHDGRNGAPLQGIHVVEAAGYVAGPFATFMLAQLGAEVVKVEPPGGDPLRRFGVTRESVSAMWVNLNQGKRLVTLDLKSEEGHRRMLDLLDEADVFVQNWRPGVAASLGLDAGVLSERNPSLITLAISGFGDTGPKASTPVFDVLLQAASGLAVSESTPDGPRALRSLIADKTTAGFAVQAVLAALVSRAASGRGTNIDLAMLDVMAYFDFPDLCQDRTFLSPDAQITLEKGRTGLLETSDGYVAVAPTSGRHIASALAAVGHPEWKEELKRTNSPTALNNLLFDRLETITRTGSTDEWVQSFLDHDVPAAAVISIDQHLADPQTVNNHLYEEVDSPVGPLRRVRHPAQMGGEYLASHLGW
jgi:crotonobetainyl-CoA:carnitine CoA-transferase CaiB-like acyl-CoA transferase